MRLFKNAAVVAEPFEVGAGAGVEGAVDGAAHGRAGGAGGAADLPAVRFEMAVGEERLAAP